MNEKQEEQSLEATESPVKVLLKAADLVERGWTRGANARNIHGRPVPASSPDAVKWCGEGALIRASRTSGSHPLVMSLRESLVRHVHCGVDSFYIWNDRKARSGKHVAKVMRDLAALTQAAPQPPKNSPSASKEG